MLASAPSVLFDAVAILVSTAGARQLAAHAAARQFVADAFAHCKLIAYTAEAGPLLERAGLRALDAGCFDLGKDGGADAFVTACGQLRYWDREIAPEP
jgi:catalase